MDNRALWDLQDWLPLSDAARYLSAADVRVGKADVLRLALDGRLKLYVHLPSIPATPQTNGTSAREKRNIDGLWELKLEGSARVEIEAMYRDAAGFSPVRPRKMAGALVSKDGEVFELPAERENPIGFAPRHASAFPRGSLIAFRTEDLRQLAADLSQAKAASEGNSDKPLGRRERDVLLTIIAALAGEAKIDRSKPTKAAGQIQALTVRLGARVGLRTIEDHLKAIEEALERRGSDADNS